MCLLIVKRPNITIPKYILENAFNANKDGCGFAFSKKNKLIIIKGLLNFEAFYNEFDKNQKGNPMLVHFRKKTNGNIDDENCHPFYINDKVAVAHNGTLENWTDAKKKKSDTLWFIEGILQPLIEKMPDAYLDKTIKYLLENEIGNRNKIA